KRYLLTKPETLCQASSSHCAWESNETKISHAADDLELFRISREIADANGFPDHEIVQRLPGFVHDKSDNDPVIDEAEQRSHVRNQIEWVDQIVESRHDQRQIIIRNLLVFTAL